MITTVSRRSRFEIYVDILTEIESGTVLPTQIMYGANMSWNTLKRTLDKLTAQGFITEQPIYGNKISKRSYTLTEKGGNVLKYLKNVNKILDPDIMDIII